MLNKSCEKACNAIMNVINIACFNMLIAKQVQGLYIIVYTSTIKY